MGPGTAGRQLAQPAFPNPREQQVPRSPGAFGQAENVARGRSLFCVGKGTKAQKKKMIAGGHRAICGSAF